MSNPQIQKTVQKKIISNALLTTSPQLQVPIKSPYPMTKSPTERVLAIYPTTKGFAYFIAESTDKVIDFGNVSNKDHDKLVQRFLHFIDIYYIDRIIFEHFDKVSTRQEKAQNLVKEFKAHTRSKHIKISSYSLSQVRTVFNATGALTKHERAVEVSEIIPALASRLPNKRKIFESENLGVFIFDCAAMALTH